jgi:hypothetical protein
MNLKIFLDNLIEVTPETIEIAIKAEYEAGKEIVDTNDGLPIKPPQKNFKTRASAIGQLYKVKDTILTDFIIRNRQ